MIYLTIDFLGDHLLYRFLYDIYLYDYCSNIVLVDNDHTHFEFMTTNVSKHWRFMCTKDREQCNTMSSFD